MTKTELLAEIQKRITAHTELRDQGSAMVRACLESSAYVEAAEYAVGVDRVNDRLAVYKQLQLLLLDLCSLN